MELLRQLRPGLVAAVLIALTVLIASGCIADDESTASFGQGTTSQVTLPPVTAGPEPEAGDDAGNNADDKADDSGDEPTITTEASTTTEALDPLQGLSTELLAEGFDQPILVTGAPGTTALFVVERKGLIRLVDDGVVAAEPFLDLRAELTSSSIEQGLLGLAFHPDYEQTGRFFAYWTGPSGDSRLAEFRASSPTVADPESATVILEVAQPAERHNAGGLAFGPDGLLYLSLGDGGSGGSTAQDTSNLLGSILRLDVAEPGTYTVPPGNPLGDEIWVWGLRNPWRFSIDPVDELMYIGDVGQERFEEINVTPLDDGGANFGWFEMEGDDCFRAGCESSSMTSPVLQYSHQEGCSVTGGHVYRGNAIPEFDGHYFFADWCKSFVRSFRYDGQAVRDQFDWTEDLSLGQVTSFGLDNDLELHAVNWDGQLFKIVPVR